MTDHLGTVSPPARGDAVIRFTDLPPEWSGGWLRLARVFGPGAVMASVTVGTGETIFSPRLGAIFGYQVLWIIALAVIFKGVLVYTGARHLVLTGEHPMQAWAGLPGPRAWLPTLIGGVAIVSFPLWIGALTDAVASLCVWITGWGQDVAWGRPAWSTAIILTAMTLSVIQTYHVVERVSTLFLGLKVFFIVVAIVVIRPDWVAALAGLVTPRLPEFPSWLPQQYPEIAAQGSLFQLATSDSCARRTGARRPPRDPPDRARCPAMPSRSAADAAGFALRCSTSSRRSPRCS
jgi:Mn2+/Fe2+ NRAMP family transporter